MSELLSSITGGGGGFKPSFISGQISLSSGASGDIITITPPSGKAVNLTGLATSVNTAESGVSLTVGGVTIVNGLDLAGGTTGVGEFQVAQTSNAGTTTSSVGSTQDILGAIDEVIIVKKDTGNTTQTILYSYEYGS